MFAVWTVVSCKAPQGKASVFGRLAAEAQGKASVFGRMAAGVQGTAVSLSRSLDGELDPVDRQARYLINHSPR